MPGDCGQVPGTEKTLVSEVFCREVGTESSGRGASEMFALSSYSSLNVQSVS